MIAGEKTILRALDPHDLDRCYRWMNDPPIVRALKSRYPMPFQQEAAWLERTVLELQSERHFAIPWMVASGLLLYSGVVFALELLLPAMVTMLRSFATAQMEARVSITSLLDFTVKLAVGCGLLFQMPLVICLAAWFGIVSPRILARSWRHAILFIAIGSAVVTPGDGPSMSIILAAPLIVLYFISVVMAWFLWRVRGRGADHPTVSG